MIRTAVLILLLAMLSSCGGDSTPSSNTSVPALPADLRDAVLRPSDLTGFPHTSPAEDWQGFPPVLATCDSTSLLAGVDLLAANGDVVIGEHFSETPLGVQGGKGVSSFVFRFEDAEAAKDVSDVLASTTVWECVNNSFVDEITSAGFEARSEGVATLSAADGEGLSRAVESAISRTTTDGSNVPFTAYETYVTIQLENTVALLFLNNNDGPFPEDLRVQLTKHTIDRLKAMQ